MTLTELARKFERLVVDNSPVILTAIGVTGTVMTAYFTGKASFKAADLIRERSDAVGISSRDMYAKEKVELTWRLYLPAMISGSLTVAAVVGANRVGTRRAAALAAAYSLSEKAFETYRQKMEETLGPNKSRKIRDEIAQEQVDKNPSSNNQIILTGTGEVLCYEAFTGRYFKSDMETLRKAENTINHQVIRDSYASLSDLYDQIGLSHTANSDEIGWNSDRLLSLQFSAVLSDQNVPCISVDFSVAPVRHFYRLQ